MKLINSISETIKVKPNETNLSSFRVIADHLRASSFLLVRGFFHLMKVEDMF